MAYFYNRSILSSPNFVFYPPLYPNQFLSSPVYDESTLLNTDIQPGFLWVKDTSYNTILLLSLCVLLWVPFLNFLSAVGLTTLAKLLSFVARKITKTTVGLFITLLLSTVLAPLNMLLFLIKTIALRVSFSKYGDTISLPRGNDAIWGAADEFGGPLINGLVTLEGELDIEEIRNLFQKNVIEARLPDGKLQFRKLTQVFESHFGYPVWRDVENFDLKKHIRTVDLSNVLSESESKCNASNELQTSTCTEDLVCRYLSQQSPKRLPDDIPQWEILCYKEENESGFKVILRLHHAIADGLAFMRFLLEIISDKPNRVPLLPPIHPIQRIITNIWSLCLISLSAIRYLTSGQQNPLHGKSLTGRKIYVTSKPIPIDVIKNLRKRLKCALSDILFSCFTSSLATFFESKGCEVSEITALVPFGYEDLTVPVQLENTFALGIINLPIPSNKKLLSKTPEEKLDKVGPSVRRLRIIQKSSDSDKEDPTIASVYWLTTFVCWLFPSALCALIFNTKGKTMGISNLPGPPNEVSMWNRKVSAMRFWIPDRNPTGAGFTLMGYNGYIRASFSVDEGIISSEEEAKEIIEHFSKAIDDLKKEV